MEIKKKYLIKENKNNVIYTAVFFNTNEVVSKYKQVHPNLYSHHSTIEFKPTDISNLPIGEEINIKVIGRLTNDKVDVLVVRNPLSKNKFPHITLSTAEGIKPFQSNVEIENNQDKIKPINDNLIGIVGYFDGRNEVTDKQTQFEEMEVTKRQLQDEEVTAYHGSPYSFKKFSTQNIGTGEGAQAFGWGLYFTDLESIAMAYAKKLSGDEYSYDGKLISKDAYEYLHVVDDSYGENFNEKTIKLLAKKAIDTINNEYIPDLKEIGQTSRSQKQREDIPFDIKRLENVVSELNDIIASKDIKKSTNKNLYKVSLHKGKRPEQYNWLVWDKPMTEEIKHKFKNAGFIWDYEKIPLRQGQAYSKFASQINEKIKDSNEAQKQASLFLLRAGIDGIKYPAESIARGATSDTARGFNYVVFDENAVSIEKQTQFEEMEIKKKDLIQNWLNNPKKLKEDAEDVNFMFEITKGELEEAKKKKADRCTRIAKRKYDVWPSAYSSAAVVRCRQGKIWRKEK